MSFVNSWATTAGRLLGPKMRNYVLNVSQAYSDALYRIGKGVGRKFPGEGQRKNQDREIAPISFPPLY